MRQGINKKKGHSLVENTAGDEKPTPFLNGVVFYFFNFFFSFLLNDQVDKFIRKKWASVLIGFLKSF